MGAAESRPRTPDPEEFHPSYMDRTSPIAITDPLTSAFDEDSQRSCDPLVCGGVVSSEGHIPARERVPSIGRAHEPLSGGISDTVVQMSPTQQTLDHCLDVWPNAKHLEGFYRLDDDTEGKPVPHRVSVNQGAVKAVFFLQQLQECTALLEASLDIFHRFVDDCAACMPSDKANVFKQQHVLWMSRESVCLPLLEFSLSPECGSEGVDYITMRTVVAYIDEALTSQRAPQLQPCRLFVRNDGALILSFSATESLYALQDCLIETVRETVPNIDIHAAPAPLCVILGHVLGLPDLKPKYRKAIIGVVTKWQEQLATNVVPYGIVSAKKFQLPRANIPASFWVLSLVRETHYWLQNFETEGEFELSM